MARDRLSRPGPFGVPIPTRPDSRPPEEKILGELANLEGRVLARLSDLSGRLDALDERQGGADDDVRAMRVDVAQLRQDIGSLMAALLQAQASDTRLTRDVGDLRAELVAEGRSAGGRRGALAGIGAALAAIFARWLASKAGIDL